MLPVRVDDLKTSLQSAHFKFLLRLVKKGSRCTSRHSRMQHRASVPDGVLYPISAIQGVLPAPAAALAARRSSEILLDPGSLSSMTGPITYADKDDFIHRDVVLPSSILLNREDQLSQDALDDSENEQAPKSGDSPTSVHTSISAPSIRDGDQASRPKRKRISPVQLETLVSLFTETDTPTYEVREAVGRQLGMSNREVQVWFQNRRAKERNSRQRQQYQALKEARLHGQPSADISQSVVLGTTHGGALANQSAHSSAMPTGPPLATPNMSRSHSGSGDNPESSRMRSISPTDCWRSEDARTQPAPQLFHDASQTPESTVQTAIGPIRPRNMRQGSSQTHPFARPIAPVTDPRPAFRHSRVPSAGAILSAPRVEASPLPQRTLSYQDSRRRTETYTSGFGTRASEDCPIERPVILDRRQATQSNRLPPIRLLLDMADQAERTGIPSHIRPISATATSPLATWSATSPSSQTNPLSSPFSHLNVQDTNAPALHTTEVSLDGSWYRPHDRHEGGSYFDQRFSRPNERL